MNKYYQKTGYLNGDFKLFHLKDNNLEKIRFHYHDFYKILIFLNGNASYSIESREYSLLPDDIILVGAGEIHKPILHDSSPYERIIIYISPDFFESYRRQGHDLSFCFEMAKKQQSNLIRLSDSGKHLLQPITNALVSSSQKTFATELYQRVKFIEYLIVLNRIVLDESTSFAAESSTNPVVRKIMSYINEHLTEELSIDHIADNVFLDRSYIMHLFKSETGYTIGKYITEKRLFQARRLISSGLPITEACFKCGFNNYATFYHAYKAKYHASPKTASSGILPAHIYPE